MKRDFLAAALVCVIAVLITGGCAGNSSAGNTPQTSAPASESSVESQLAPAESTDASGKKVELLFYHHMAEMTEYLTDFCDDMTEKYPNIKIEQETQKDTATLQVKYAAGDDPDLVLGPQTQQYYDQGKYLDLTDEYAEIISQLDPDLMDVITDAKTGKIFRIPQCINTFGIFYNKD
ncbi:MAG: extracellular solute-binding protein, partial [Clostridiales bacterium]|nr:extracellular solute-binding protein [Clostridiales bacterium]